MLVPFGHNNFEIGAYMYQLEASCILYANACNIDSTVQVLVCLFLIAHCVLTGKASYNNSCCYEPILAKMSIMTC